MPGVMLAADAARPARGRARGQARSLWRAWTMAWVLGCGAALLSSSANAGLFDDDEARRAILDLRARIQSSDDASKARSTELAASSAASLSTLNAQLLDQLQLLQQLRRSLLELNAQLESSRGDTARLRGTQEQLARDVAELQRRQKDAVQGVEERLRKIEPQTISFEGKDFLVEPDERRLHDEAMATMRAADFNKSAVQLATFLSRYPSSGFAPSVRFWLGNALYGKKDYKEAIATFRSLAADLPEHPRAPEALLSVANCQFEMKDAKGARRTLDDVIKIYPKSEAAAAAKDRLVSIKG